MDTLQVILATLIIYSAISSALYIALNENDNVLILFGLGITGILTFGIFWSGNKIRQILKYHAGKRSIFDNLDDGKRYKCRVGQAKNVQWLDNYKLVDGLEFETL